MNLSTLTAEMRLMLPRMKYQKDVSMIHMTIKERRGIYRHPATSERMLRRPLIIQEVSETETLFIISSASHSHRLFEDRARRWITVHVDGHIYTDRTVPFKVIIRLNRMIKELSR